MGLRPIPFNPLRRVAFLRPRQLPACAFHLEALRLGQLLLTSTANLLEPEARKSFVQHLLHCDRPPNYFLRDPVTQKSLSGVDVLRLLSVAPVALRGFFTPQVFRPLAGRDLQQDAESLAN